MGEIWKMVSVRDASRGILQQNYAPLIPRYIDSVSDEVEFPDDGRPTDLPAASIAISHHVLF